MLMVINFENDDTDSDSFANYRDNDDGDGVLTKDELTRIMMEL